MCTVLNKDSAVEAKIIFIGPPPVPPCTPLVPKVEGGIVPPPTLPGCAARHNKLMTDKLQLQLVSINLLIRSIFEH